MSYAEAESELALSKKYLEGMLQRSVDFIAYPRGGYNHETIEAAVDAKYFGGFKVIPGVCSQGANPYLLKRIPIFSFSGDVRHTMLASGCT